MQKVLVIISGRLLRNKIPGKGTETRDNSVLRTKVLTLRNKIPGKGTETRDNSVLRTKVLTLRNKIPGKGTETLMVFPSGVLLWIEK